MFPFSLLTVTPTPTENLVTSSTALVDLFATIGDLFTTFPINLFLAGGVIGIVFMIFRKGKGAVR